jgi:pyruvate-formate lyase-activating enzyme
MSIADILTRISKESIQTFILDPVHLQSISPKSRIRKELLRFHPDRRTQWLKNVKDDEKEQVDEACKQVVLHLTDLLNVASR